MPTSTFFALASERRERLVSEAITEFSEHTYGDASVSRLARRSGIAQGSL